MNITTRRSFGLNCVRLPDLIPMLPDLLQDSDATALGASLTSSRVSSGAYLYYFRRALQSVLALRWLVAPRWSPGTARRTSRKATPHELVSLTGPDRGHQEASKYRGGDPTRAGLPCQILGRHRLLGTEPCCTARAALPGRPLGRCHLA